MIVIQQEPEGDFTITVTVGENQQIAYRLHFSQEMGDSGSDISVWTLTNRRTGEEAKRFLKTDAENVALRKAID